MFMRFNLNTIYPVQWCSIHTVCTVYVYWPHAGTACTTRIGHHVGAGSETRARLVYRLTMLLHAAFGLLTAAAYVALRYQLVAIFTSDDQIINVRFQFPDF